MRGIKGFCCPRGHLLSADNKLRNAQRRFFWCRECRRQHQWLIKRGLRFSDYTAEELKMIVPPRKIRIHPRALPASQRLPR